MSPPDGTPAHRYRALDTYRFLAASGIVVYHFENHFQPFLRVPSHVLENFQLFVDFFFVLSGFVIMHGYGSRIAGWRDYADFLRKRLARIYPLHVATMALFCAIGAVTVLFGVAARDRSFFDLSLVPANLLLVQAWGATDHAGLNVPSWSISAEWFVYLLFPVLALLLRRVGGWVALCIAAVLALCIIAIRTGAGLGPADSATFDFGNFRALPPFLAGMAICVLVEAMPSARVSWPLTHGFALLVLVLMLAGAPPLLIVALFTALVALLGLADRPGRPSLVTSRVGVLLGDASFAIYMIHTFFQVAAVIVVRRFGWTEVWQLALVAIVTYTSIVLAGLASYRWFEDPLRRHFSRGAVRPVVRRGVSHVG